MTVKPEAKFNLRVVLSGKCNYKCTFCSLDFNQGDPNRNMRTDFLNGCVKTFARLGGERVHFSGGEPLLYPHLNGALRLVRSLGMSNALTTNGALLGAQGTKLSALVELRQKETAEKTATSCWKLPAAAALPFSTMEKSTWPSRRKAPWGKPSWGKKRAMRSSSRPPGSRAMLWSPFRDGFCCERH